MLKKILLLVFILLLGGLSFIYNEANNKLEVYERILSKQEEKPTLETFIFKDIDKFVVEKDLLQKIQDTYSKEIYNITDEINIFTTKEITGTIKEFRDDFFQLLPEYIKSKQILQINTELLAKQYEPKKFILDEYRLMNFYGVLFDFIVYIDKQGKEKLANQLLKKYFEDLNHLIEFGYSMDYVFSMTSYRYIYTKLECNSSDRKEIFNKNTEFLKNIFFKRLKSERAIFLAGLDRLNISDNTQNQKKYFENFSMFFYDANMELITQLFEKNDLHTLNTYKIELENEEKQLKAQNDFDTIVYYVMSLINNDVIVTYNLSKGMVNQRLYSLIDRFIMLDGILVQHKNYLNDCE